MFVYVSMFSYSAPVIFQLNSAISHLPENQNTYVTLESAPSPSPERMWTQHDHTGWPRSVFQSPAAGSWERLWPVPPSSAWGSSAPPNPTSSLGFSLCTHGGLGPRSPPPFTLFRSIRPPQLYWKINDSPDQMPPFRGSKSGFRWSQGQAPGTHTHTHTRRGLCMTPARPPPPGLPSEASTLLPQDPSPSFP